MRDLDPLGRVLRDFAYEDRGYRNECWITRLKPENKGYVRVTREKLLGHRLTYSAYRGDVPDGLVLDHLC
mgnify:CR=1 FL=1